MRNKFEFLAVNYFRKKVLSEIFDWVLKVWCLGGHLFKLLPRKMVEDIQTIHRQISKKLFECVY